MADLLSVVQTIASAALGSLGQQQDIAPSFSFRDLYSVFGLVALLAMFNATLIMSYIALGALKIGNRALFLAGKCVYVAGLVMQCILGLAPVILLLRAWVKDYELSFRVYGLPSLQLAFIILIVYYQIRVVIMHARMQKLPPITN